MFTINQINQAHGKVKSGTDFPTYINDIKKLGVIHYETTVADGNTSYYGANKNIVCTGPRYNTLLVADALVKKDFSNILKAHQQGKTDYNTFCYDCAKTGIAKWIVNLEKMTCTYYSLSGEEVLVENVPV